MKYSQNQDLEQALQIVVNVWSENIFLSQSYPSHYCLMLQETANNQANA